MSEEVKVRVTITERVRHSAIVKMPREQFEALDKQWEAARGREVSQIEERIGEFCDRIADFQGADDLEVEEFELVDDDGE